MEIYGLYLGTQLISLIHYIENAFVALSITKPSSVVLANCSLTICDLKWFLAPNFCSRSEGYVIDQLWERTKETEGNFKTYECRVHIFIYVSSLITDYLNFNKVVTPSFGKQGHSVRMWYHRVCALMLSYPPELISVIWRAGIILGEFQDPPGYW